MLVRKECVPGFAGVARRQYAVSCRELLLSRAPGDETAVYPGGQRGLKSQRASRQKMGCPAKAPLRQQSRLDRPRSPRALSAFRAHRGLTATGLPGGRRKRAARLLPKAIRPVLTANPPLFPPVGRGGLR